MVEPAAVLTTHLTKVARARRRNLTRDATRHLVEELKKGSPAVVDELIPKPMSLAEVQQVLQMLLREGVPIRQLAAILEALGDNVARCGKDMVMLVEQVRYRLARAICGRYRDDEKRLFVVTLDPLLEDRIRAGIEHSEKGLFVRMSPQAISATCDLIHREVEKLASRQRPRIVLVNAHIRPGLKQLTARHLPKLVVLSYNEITRDTQIESVWFGERRRAALTGGSRHGLGPLPATGVRHVALAAKRVRRTSVGYGNRTYRAANMQEALAMVRDDLGPQAAILHTREVGGRGWLRWLPGGRKIEVTASAEVNVPSRLPACGGVVDRAFAVADVASRRAGVAAFATAAVGCVVRGESVS